MSLLRSTLSVRSRPAQRCLSRLSHLHTDAHHPRGLYWHDLGKRDDQNVYALSFLKDEPVSPYSITNIGLVRGQELNEKTFEPARDWVHLVNAVLGQRFPESVLLQTQAATRPLDGYIHINDERNLPDENRVADPDDILAMCLVQQGKLVPGSWEPMPTYRLYSPRLGGLMCLNQELHDLLVDGLKVARQMELEQGPD